MTKEDVGVLQQGRPQAPYLRVSPTSRGLTLSFLHARAVPRSLLRVHRVHARTCVCVCVCSRGVGPTLTLGRTQLFGHPPTCPTPTASNFSSSAKLVNKSAIKGRDHSKGRTRDACASFAFASPRPASPNCDHLWVSLESPGSKHPNSQPGGASTTHSQRRPKARPNKRQSWGRRNDAPSQVYGAATESLGGRASRFGRARSDRLAAPELTSRRHPSQAESRLLVQIRCGAQFRRTPIAGVGRAHDRPPVASPRQPRRTGGDTLLPPAWGSTRLQAQRCTIGRKSGREDRDEGIKQPVKQGEVSRLSRSL